MIRWFILLLQIEDDAYQEDLGFSLGQLGKSGSGRVRQAQVNEATKARISKSLQVKTLSTSLNSSSSMEHSILSWFLMCV